MIHVIGSGPAGVSCAMALLERGADVQMLDAGIELETSNQADVQRLSSVAPEQWDATSLARMKTNTQASTEGIPQKVAFGSDFPYQQTGEFIPLTREGVHVLPSMARGGLSNVWGAAVLPHRAEELKDWPITLQELEPHYQAVLKFIPFSGAKDDLEALFPLYTNTAEDLPLSRQGQTFAARFTQNKTRLKNAGIHWGRSRLAVRTNTNTDGQKGCVTCGLCLYGCPYGCIYCSDQTLQVLMRHPKFRYQKDVVVKRLEETAGSVTIYAEQRVTRKPLTFSSTRVFLGAGILPTTQILLESLKAYHRALPMAYSQHFMFPLLSSAGQPDVAHERLHTLSQLFLEVLDPRISAETVHLQFYTYNDLYAEALKKSLLGPLFKAMPALRDGALGRLLIIQGYLHSRYSSPISIQLKKGMDGGPARLVLKGRLNSVVQSKVRQVMQKLAMNSRWIGAFPILPMLKISPPGQGFHNVGTFPMRRTPGEFESDRLGQPYGFKNVHVVDATVLPSAPASTITLSVMANAHRIGVNCTL